MQLLKNYGFHCIGGFHCIESPQVPHIKLRYLVINICNPLLLPSVVPKFEGLSNKFPDNVPNSDPRIHTVHYRRGMYWMTGSFVNNFPDP